MHKKRRKASNKPLTDQQRQAAQLMFDGHRIGKIAAEIGVHRTTIWRWYHRRDFQKEIDHIHDQHIRDMRRKIKKEIAESSEHKRALAAQRKLSKLARNLEAAGNSGNMKAYAEASKAYDKCFSDAYLGGKTFFDILNIYHNFSRPPKVSKPKKYIIEIVK